MNQIASFAKNFAEVKANIEKTCMNFGRNHSEIEILAVSKQISAEKIIEAIKQGQRIFGENYLQEAKQKWPEILRQFPQVKLHFIGHLQSNKAKEAVELFDCIESLESEKLARILQKEMQKKTVANQHFARDFDQLDIVNSSIHDFNNVDLRQTQKQAREIELLLQVNIGCEPQKSGLKPEEVKDFYDFCLHELKMKITGFMAIPPSNCNPSPYFALLTKIAYKCFFDVENPSFFSGFDGKNHQKFPKISMGMSADYQEAIAMGSTQIRLGSVLFSERMQQKLQIKED